ncbi:unnamed protein product [Orchesella dallaii]|uniref:Uncharacterized protein n=1 Tax=Orchesella dallaii TaxID=48710 RepID=A0ABP1RI92_9HEXA
MATKLTMGVLLLIGALFIIGLTGVTEGQGMRWACNTLCGNVWGRDDEGDDMDDMDDGMIRGTHYRFPRYRPNYPGMWGKF